MRWPETIIVSRTDSIGDVMLTLPMMGMLRGHYPKAKLVFLGRTYTEPVLRRCAHVDEVITLEELQANEGRDAVAILRRVNADAIIHVFPERHVASWAKRAGIPHRIGTGHRWWHWTTCNERVSFTRRNSPLHEAQLNTKLLAPFDITGVPSLEALTALYGFEPGKPNDTVRALLRNGRKHVVLHPLSKGSAVEWGLDRFTELIRLLDPARYHVLITGTESEAVRYRSVLPVNMQHVSDTGGQLSLDELITLIGASDALVAASTGPLHIAAASGIRTVGLFASQRPIHPGRWAPLGRDVHVLVDRSAARLEDPAAQVHAITPERVLRLLDPM